MPWEIIPFVLGFFIIIEAFYANGITQAVADWFVSVFDGNIFSSVFSVGILSTLSANLMNNIPMTVFFSGLLQGFAAGTAQLGALYALIVGSNFGAILTPIGALAGIMWLKMLKHEKINLSFRQFMIYGAKVILVTLLVTLLCIFIIFAFF
jgi:arsenical pump membrane protein